MTAMAHDTRPGTTVRGRGRLASGLGFALVSATGFGMSGALARGLLDTDWSPGAVVLVRIALAALVPVAIIGALFDEAIDLAARVGALLAADPDFELAAKPQLSTLVFRYRPLLDDGTRLSDDAADSVNPAIRAHVFASGKAVVAGTKVDGRHFLKFTLLNAEATLEDISEIIELLRGTGGGLLKRQEVAA